jgi:hypothetical protein
MAAPEAVWTVGRVRAELPAVRVLVAGQEFTGKITGRSNDVATVTVDCGCMWCKNRNYHKLDYAWSTVARAMQENTALRA